MNDRLPPKPPAPGRRISIALAVAVHVVLAIFLIYGVRWQSQRPEAVEVELVRATPAPAAVPPPPTPALKPEPEPVPVPKIEPKREPPPKADIAIKEKKEKPKPPPKEEPPPRFNPGDEMLNRDLKELAARRETETAANELAQLKAAQAATARNKALADYSDAIRGKIRGNIVLPTEPKGNPTAIFEVTQLPSGEVIDARLLKPSGNAGYDEAVGRAIRKSSPLPKPRDPSDFQRSLKLTFCPNEGGCT